MALLRGRLPNSLVTIRTRLCSPSEGSKRWRLAGTRVEGQVKLAERCLKALF